MKCVSGERHADQKHIALIKSGKLIYGELETDFYFLREEEETVDIVVADSNKLKLGLWQNHLCLWQCHKHRGKCHKKTDKTRDFLWQNRLLLWHCHNNMENCHKDAREGAFADKSRGVYDCTMSEGRSTADLEMRGGNEWNG